MPVDHARSLKEATASPHPLLLALWLALSAGLLEACVRLTQRLVFHRVTLVSPHIIWMAPLADLVWLLGPILLLTLLMAWMPRLREHPLVTAVPVFVAVLSLILLVTSMQKGVALFLAAALAIQASRLIRRHPEGARRIIRKTLPFLLVLPVLGGVGLWAGRSWQEHRALSRLGPAAPGAPNVLLIIWDTVRDQNVSLAGYERPTTPELARTAAAGAHFTMAFATAPWTLPSHASMFTGQRPLLTGTTMKGPLNDRYPTLAGVLGRHGYRTGGFVANTYYATREHGLDRGFQHYEDYRLTSLGTALIASQLGSVLLDQDWVRRLVGYWNLPGRKTAARVNRDFLRWAGRGERPFFAFLNYLDAHQPYLPPAPWQEKMGALPNPGFHPRTRHATVNQMTPAEIAWSERTYDAAIAYEDHETAQLLEALRRRGLLDGTLVIIASDHGEHFGEHGRIAHMNSMYRQLLQVPLVIRYPAAVPAGVTVTAPVSLGDLPSTILDLAVIRDSVFPGRSLARFWGQTPADPDSVIFSEMGNPYPPLAISLVAGGYHYVKWFNAPPELYNLAADPQEQDNLAAQDSSAVQAFGPIVRRLEQPARIRANGAAAP